MPFRPKTRCDAQNTSRWFLGFRPSLLRYGDIGNSDRTLQLGVPHTSGSRGLWCRAPLAPKIFFFSKSCSFQAILRENPLFWAKFGLSPPLGSKLCGADVPHYMQVDFSLRLVYAVRRGERNGPFWTKMNSCPQNTLRAVLGGVLHFLLLLRRQDKPPKLGLVCCGQKTPRRTSFLVVTHSHCLHPHVACIPRIRWVNPAIQNRSVPCFLWRQFRTGFFLELRATS